MTGADSRRTVRSGHERRSIADCRADERLVPFMTVGFLLLCGAVLILRRERLPDAVAGDPA